MHMRASSWSSIGTADTCEYANSYVSLDLHNTLSQSITLVSEDHRPLPNTSLLDLICGVMHEQL
jgi:hypothetical protein